MKSVLPGIASYGRWSKSFCTNVTCKVPLVACALIALQFHHDVFAESRSHTKEPRKVLIAIGGGGEASDEINQFDPYLHSIAGLAKKGWETTLHFDFDHLPTCRLKSVSP